MGWLTTPLPAVAITSDPTPNNRIIVNEKSLVETITYFGLVFIVHTRTRTITDYKWVGMTQAAAVAYKNEHAGDANVTDAHVTHGTGGQYQVFITTDVRGSYSS